MSTKRMSKKDLDVLKQELVTIMNLATVKGTLNEHR